MFENTKRTVRITSGRIAAAMRASKKLVYTNDELNDLLKEIFGWKKMPVLLMTLAFGGLDSAIQLAGFKKVGDKIIRRPETLRG